jgi:GNAT superfamily N-acetyltransferase
MITYQVEKWDDCYEEAIPMLHAHYIEIATDKAIKPLDPDLDKYQSMEKAGMLRIFTARESIVEEHIQERIPGKLQGREEVMTVKRGRLIGYFVSIVATGLHYQQTTLAINDIMYVDPPHRGSTVGYRLMKGAALDLKNLGADILTIHMKTDYPFRSLLEKLDFHLTEENWERVL